MNLKNIIIYSKPNIQWLAPTLLRLFCQTIVPKLTCNAQSLSSVYTQVFLKKRLTCELQTGLWSSSSLSGGRLSLNQRQGLRTTSAPARGKVWGCLLKMFVPHQQHPTENESMTTTGPALPCDEISYESREDDYCSLENQQLHFP